MASYGLLILLLVFSSLTSAAPNCGQALSGTLEDEKSTEAPDASSRLHTPSFFLKTIKDALTPFPSAKNLSFDGPELSRRQLKALARFSSKAGSPLQKGDHIHIVRFEEMKTEVFSSGIKQRVFANDAFETELIEKSLIDSNPREVLTFRLHHRDGSVTPVPILIKGDINSVDFTDGFSALFQFLRGKLSGIEAIEVLHTHPTYSVLVTSSSGATKFRGNEIRETDLQDTQDFSLKLPKETGVILTAVLPNGFNYKARWAKR
jgi:hypothetical protein